MKHLGDITKISGYDAPVVDCVIFGAPCQDLSVAGKRAGMKHSNLGDEEATRSGLFMEAVRIIKEMRTKDENERRCSAEFIRPRFAVYENVPGAFSSNKGEDFKIVLEELAKVIDKDAVIPMPPKGKWTNSGSIVGDGWSIAWRILDGQFLGCTYVDDDGVPIRLGTPQRRKRIALVADFGGECAAEILFERKSLRGNFEESGSEGEGIPSDTEGGSFADDRKGEKSTTLSMNWQAAAGAGLCVEGEMVSPLCCTRVPAVSILQVPMVMEAVGVDVYNQTTTGDVACALTAEGYTSTGSCPKVMVAVGIDCYNQAVTGDKAKALTNRATDSDHIPCVAIDRAFFNQGKNALYDPQVYDDGTVPTLVAKGPSAVAYVTSSDGDIAGTLDASYYKGVGTRRDRERTYIAFCIGNGQANDATNMQEDVCNTLNCMVDPMKVMICSRAEYIVRRLTPMECERLQGYPDLWTDIGDFIDSKGKKKTSSDAVRYKALGNSICLPPWKWVLKRLCSHYERDATMASLFDGIGGFPYLWEQINGKGTAVWASEIEEFPVAVTKVRIG